MNQNPLLQELNLAFNSIPFSEIKTSHFLPAFTAAISNSKQEINEIASNAAKPNFNNTIEALEKSGKLLSRVSSVFFNLNSAHTSDEIQAIAQEVSPKLSELSNDIRLNPDLFAKVKIVHQQKNKLNLTPEQHKLLQETYLSFTRNGANLDANSQQNLREIDKQLSSLGLQFMQNTLAETNAYTLHLTAKDEVLGLPADALQAAKEEAKSKQLNGWVFSLQYPSYVPFMKYAQRRDLREQMYKAFGSISFNNNELDNQELIKKITDLRSKRAKLLGYASHADFVLEKRMAKSTQNVHEFLEDLLHKAKPFATQEIKELQDLAKELDGLDAIMPWDHAYYAEKLKQKKFSLAEEELKPYFQLGNVLQGAFSLANQLFQISFKPVDNIDVYHKDVAVYEVLDSNQQHLALLYTDFHPRSSKRAGAWMTSYRGQSNHNGNNQRPHIAVVCNFSKPTNNTPALLTFNEVSTLFHEFGHALHGILANTQYESLSGTNVYWDFVELPSQFLENFCYEPQVLQSFAKHYKTNEVIPTQLIEKIKKSANFMEAYQTLRQVSFGLLDMAWHGNNPSKQAVKEVENQVFEPTNLYPTIDEVCMSCSFNHIFSGGYSAGYYSYKWAELLDADAFDYFKQNGLFDAGIAQKFKQLLSSGGTKDPMDLYVEFRGKKPDSNALLKRAGLMQ